MNSLGQRIREIRIKRGLTQIELANGLCTPSMISQMETDKARPSYKMLVALAAKLDVPLEKLLDHIELGMESKSKFTLAKALIESGQYELATTLLEELLHAPHTEFSSTDIMYNLATCYMNISQFAKAESMFVPVAELATLRDDRQMLARIMLSLGVVAARKEEYPIAVYHTQKALDEYHKHGLTEPTLHVQILLQLAGLLQQVGKMQQAMEHYQEAVGLYENMSDLKGLGQTYLQLADAYRKQGDYAKSQEFAAQAIAAFKTLGDRMRQMDAECQMTLLERQEGKPGEVLSRLLAFADIYQQQKDAARAGEVYAEVANVCLEERNFEEARSYAERAGSLLPEEHEVMGKVQRVLAFVSFAGGETEQGYLHLEQAVAIFEQSGQLAQQEETVLHLCHYLVEQGRHDEAFERLEKFHDHMMKKLGERGIVL
jgi:HTH-type transcriptional regulator, quorum sensing regulator NprR